MRSKTGNAALLKRAITSSLAAVGLKETEIKFVGNKIEVPVCGVTVAPSLENGKRVWKAEGTCSVMRLEDAFENEFTQQLFTVPLEDDLLLARKLALHIAVTKVDASLDSVVQEAAGRLQR
ncbi:hypothetical protein HFO56_01980 [Rhizobium laguerreae]|uniref:hypothetical protein n=1 Tax=Rhizobium laguerreae TaxID=1076926 RepID=UPI001C915BFC|nr:hypothetical protein [Rhizobium laguerreae]MBY3151176.1 hypothetical protein [Rhizobium laguerreae]MBY3433372.1 hypothetical protein [Rhizobium laguerreae]